jgi:hypothetical protein
MGEGEFKYDIFVYCKNFCKCHNVMSPNTTIKKKKRNIMSQVSAKILLKQ